MNGWSVHLGYVLSTWGSVQLKRVPVHLGHGLSAWVPVQPGKSLSAVNADHRKKGYQVL